MSTKHEEASSPGLAALEDTYRIVGELNARDNIRGYLATRIEDGADVLVLVEETPSGDSGNALTHFAADTNLLRTLEHRNLIPIHEGRWLGPSTFALVTDRCPAPTLATLVGRGDAWTYPRIATVLHEVNGLLEWARQQKVVHRAVTLDTVHVEPGTDRVLVSFIAQPLSRKGPPGAEGDARTIATLAWALITRGRDLPATPEDSIGIVRPELPRRLVAATDALLHDTRPAGAEPPAIADYIALVAMADALMEGDVDAAELQAVVLQEQVVEREAWAAKESDLNGRMAEMERAIQEERETMARTLAEEREQMAATLAAERAAMEQTLLAAREELTATLASEREVLASERAELERRVAAEREEMERQATAEREEMSEQIAAMREQFATDRAALEAEVASERDQLAQRRAALEAEVAAERERLGATMTEGERALAAAREDFEAATAAQRHEFERLLEREREEFDRTILAERNALEAEKEGLAVFHAAERAQIESERRALEEQYQAYEAEGHRVVGDDEGARPTSSHVADRPVRGPRPLLADMARVAVAQPMSEEAPPDEGPAETEAGLTRDDARRSRRAAWGVPVAILALVAMLVAAALGLGGDEQAPVDTQVQQDLQRAAQPTPALVNRPGAVLDSAGGTVAPPARARP